MELSVIDATAFPDVRGDLADDGRGQVEDLSG
jgi:hypothetical protein